MPSEPVSVTVPARRDDSLELYRTDPLYHAVIDIAARGSGFSRGQLLDREGPEEIVVPDILVGVSYGG